MTDPRFVVVYFAIVFLVFCACGAAAEYYHLWRQEWNRRRDDRRIAVLIDRYTRGKTETPDVIPDWMMKEAA